MGAGLKRTALFTIAILCGLFVTRAVPSCASAEIAIQAGYEADFVATINQARAAAGLQPVEVESDLTEVARTHAIEMAAQGRIFHNRDLPKQVAHWLDLGENVGVGDNVEQISRDFMESPTHRYNILYAKDNRVGVGVAWVNGELFVTQIFARRVTNRGLRTAGETTEEAWTDLAVARPAGVAPPQPPDAPPAAPRAPDPSRPLRCAHA